MNTRYAVTTTLFWAAGGVAVFASCDTRADEWSAYGRDSGGTRYSPLKQTTPDNVGKLQVAWTFQTGDVSDLAARSCGASRSEGWQSPSRTSLSRPKDR